LHERSGDPRWAELFCQTAAALCAQREWSAEHACDFRRQELFGQQSTYLDAVHGFAGTASPLIRGRHLFGDAAWAGWQHCIVNTVQRSATWEGDHANWRAELLAPAVGRNKTLMQFCDGAPGFVIRLAGLCDGELDALLLAAGRATWAAGPLVEGSNRVPRHRRQWPRLFQALPAHRRRLVAEPRAGVRDARYCADGRRRGAAQAGPLLAVDRRPGLCDLPLGLPAGAGALPDARRALRCAGRRVIGA